MSPFVDPIVDQFYKLREKEEVDGMVRKGSIVITPVQHMRGHNIENSILIVDEAANLTIDEFKLICSRLCKNGRIVFTCDSRQVDIKQKTNSISHYLKYIQHLKGISVVRLLENFRHPLAIQIFDILDDVQENVLKKK
jgi:phosphate starvation-inducible PhoH-like protein